jgi:tetratricopeptide (TPR) repeat protein
MKVTQKWAILTTVALLSCGAMVFGGYLYFTAKISIPSRDELEGKADLQVFYDKALNYESLISEKPAELQNYLALGGAWKLIGDNTKDRRWHKLSLNAYERGIEITNRRNSVLLTNAGHIEEQLGNYAEAKKYYSEAIDLSPGDVNYYLMYINLLRYKTKASTDEILSVYERGMERVLGGADLISNRSQYFKAIGRYADARRDLELLLTNNVITQQQMDSELLEMKKLEEAAN